MATAKPPLAYCNGAPAAAAMIRDLATLIIGMDPLDNEVIWDKLYKCTFWGQNGGPVVFAGISAIDIALWDIKGKYFGVPVYKLLGGKRRDNIRTYASQLQFGWGLDVCKDSLTMSAPPRCRHGAGLCGQRHEGGRGRVRTASRSTSLPMTPRTAMPTPMRSAAVCSPPTTSMWWKSVWLPSGEAIGPKVDIIMENHSRPDAQSAVQLGRAVQKYNIFYFEEPNTPTPKTAKFISDKLSMPISHGERVYSRWQYAPYFEDQAIQGHPA